ncbi:MAG: hypothetical protein BMS9Abin26_1893 [Gammaproteobacteria bacterium]|nr:MAG: hypothetical protein BMS9Abin26_1893 [Gammaproteobacteria bacterium]
MTLTAKQLDEVSADADTGSGSSGGASLKILIVDDTVQNIMLVEHYLNMQGHEIIHANNGEDAIALFIKEQPDVILMDVMMPGIDGYEATTRIKELTTDKWIPVIFMSALNSGQDQVRGLEAGGDDYLTKPINLNILGAKIRAMQRIANIQDKLARTTSELQRYHDNAEYEQGIAQSLMDKLIFADRLEDKMLNVWHSPASRFSGDLIAATRSNSGKLYLVHGDSTGHGLAAALPLMPVSQVFYNLAEIDAPVSKIVEEMNTQLKARMPVDRFVAATVLSIDINEGSIEIWNGGNPPVLGIDANGDKVFEVAPSHIALGVLDEDSFDNGTESCDCSNLDRVVLYSDGLIEAQNADGVCLGADALMTALKAGAGKDNNFEILKLAVNDHLNGIRAHDDISMVSISCASD